MKRKITEHVPNRNWNNKTFRNETRPANCNEHLLEPLGELDSLSYNRDWPFIRILFFPLLIFLLRASLLMPVKTECLQWKLAQFSQLIVLILLDFFFCFFLFCFEFFLNFLPSSFLFFPFFRLLHLIRFHSANFSLPLLCCPFYHINVILFILSDESGPEYTQTK